MTISSTTISFGVHPVPVNTIGTLKMPGNANSTCAGVTATVAVGFGGGNRVLQAINGKRNINTLRTIIIFLKEFINFTPFLVKIYEGIQHQELLSNLKWRLPFLLEPDKI
jgi:hypothetical protein